MKAVRLVFVALCFLLTPLQTLAWGKVGHEIVGDLAQRQLNPKALVEVKRLLATEPEPTLAGVSTWADSLRESNPELGKKTGRWHYMNYPREGECAFVPARDCPDGNCLIGAINKNFTVLSDKTRSDQERNEALKFLVHFVGDAHQPFHSGYADDKGGNTFQINYQGKAWKPFNNSDSYAAAHPNNWNLHSVWDSLIVESKGLAYREYADVLWKQSPLPFDATKRSDRPAVDWSMESCRILRADKTYPDTHVMKDDYLNKYRATTELRLRQAGARLAAMINFALGR
jgi:nuclease S1